MNWNLSVSINHKSTFKPIGYGDKLLLFGSCFSEHIGNLLISNKFQSNSNPFGILYNPKSISKAIRRVIEKRYFTEQELVYFNERWLSMDHHSSFSNSSKEVVLNKINKELEKAHEQLREGHTIIITFGTAYYYNLIETDEVVGNCHKIPANHFNRVMTSISDIVAEYTNLIDLINQFNPNVQWLFTVSPVRHWKDGATHNNWSKSTLICAVNELVQNNDSVHYFPSYEIMMDELRDHRFYEEDMIHPNDQAILHIWSKFLDSSISATSQELYKQVNEIRKACTHKPFNYESDQHQSFIKSTQNKIETLKLEFPLLNFEEEEKSLLRKNL